MPTISPIQIDPERKKRLLAAASLIDKGDLAVLKKLVELELEVEKVQSDHVSFIEKVRETVAKFQEEAMGFSSEEFKSVNERIEEIKETVEGILESKAVEELRNQLLESEQGTRSSVEKVRTQIREEVRTQMNEMAAVVGYLEDSLEDKEDYDDAELRAELDMIKARLADMPTEFDPTELQEDIDKLQEDVEELKKRPVGNTQGGVTNARIIQAFKYILKTESPVGDIDGVNTSYTVSQEIFAVLAFSLSGEVITELPNYTTAGTTITFSTALPAVYSGKDFEIKYI